MGMVNHLGKFSSQLAELTQPIRQLLSKKTAWLWASFNAVKQELAKPTVLALYDLTKVSADASSYGLGAVLMQKQNSQWKPIAYASRSMNETEKFSTYILGLKFSIETDHKPLVPLLGTKQLDKLPPRVLRFRLRLMRFDYTISHVPGKLLYTADTLSRAPITSKIVGEAEMLMELSIRNLPGSTQTCEDYQKADPICKRVIQYCQSGWPRRKGEMEAKLVPYWKERSDLTVAKDGMLLYQKRIVVPKQSQSKTLDKIHTGHQGIQRCRLLANTAVWWPGISSEVENMVHQCPKRATPNKQQMIPSELPWQKVATDLFHLIGKNYIAVVDYFSRYPEINGTTSNCIIKILKEIFSRWGRIDSISSGERIG